MHAISANSHAKTTFSPFKQKKSLPPKSTHSPNKVSLSTEVTFTSNSRFTGLQKQPPSRNRIRKRSLHQMVHPGIGACSRIRLHFGLPPILVCMSGFTIRGCIQLGEDILQLCTLRNDLRVVLNSNLKQVYSHGAIRPSYQVVRHVRLCPGRSHPVSVISTLGLPIFSFQR